MMDQILTKKQVQQKIKRIAYEIAEQNFSEKKVFLAGISENGFRLATLISKELVKIGEMEVNLVQITLNKEKLAKDEISIDVDLKQMEKKVIILVDDVFNTGRTMAYSLKPFLNGRIKKLQTVVLVDRSHKLFPIHADYTGYELSTTLKEHVSVSLQKDMGVFLK